MTDPANVWFYGYNKGATETGGVLTPTSFLTAEWNGQAANGLWATGGNWVGGDAFNVPDHAGAKVTFSNLAGDLNNKVINLGGNRTVGSITMNSFGSSTGSVLRLIGGTLVFDIGTIAPTTLTSLTNGSWMQIDRIQLNSDLVVNNTGSNLMYVYGIAGANSLTKNGAGELRLLGTDYAGFTSNIYQKSGSLLIYNNIAGSGSIIVSGGSLSVQFESNKYSVKNKLVIAGNFMINNLCYPQVGDIALDATHAINVTTNTTVVGQLASGTFEADANFTGIGGLTKNGGGKMEILSEDSTFSGGLIVNGGGLLTTLTSDLTLGALSAWHNYLGSGNVTVANSDTFVSVASVGKNATLSGSTMLLSDSAQFRYLGGGAFTLAGGTLDGGSRAGKGSLRVAGDLTFAGTTFANTPNMIIDTTGNTSVYQTGGTTGLINDFSKQGVGHHAG